MSNKQCHQLEPRSELRVDVPSCHHSICVRLVSGLAEVFGCELVRGQEYTLTPGTRIPIYSWQGCVVEVTYPGSPPSPDLAYTSTNTPMSTYANTHATLEEMRELAARSKTRGPCVMVVGGMDTGKSSLCKVLVNYAVRQGRTPVFVDLDVGQGEISVPGTVAAVVVDRPTDLREGYLVMEPIVYSFGYVTPTANRHLHETLISRLSHSVSVKVGDDDQVCSSGVIINTCGWVKDYGYDILTHTAQSFEVDVIIVLDNERLFFELQRDLPSFVKVVLQPKSGGVVDRERSYRKSARQERVRQYLYGAQNQLHPFRYDIRWEEVKIYKVLEESGKLLLRQSPYTEGLENCVLAVSLAENISEDVVETNVAGFIVVLHVDTDRQTLSILAPAPAPLPRRILLHTTIQFFDE